MYQDRRHSLKHGMVCHGVEWTDKNTLLNLIPLIRDDTLQKRISPL